MVTTKEKILVEALRLFSKGGYEAISVSMIASEVGITKGALYKHYKNKEDIFNSIIEKMIQMDYEQAKNYDMPEENIEKIEDIYANTSFESIKRYSEIQFLYWTENEFASNFRKMLTLEQYCNEKMANLYQQYLAGGPLKYMTDIFDKTINEKNGSELALLFYSPIFMLYSVYDSAEDKEKVKNILHKHIEYFFENLI